MSVFLELLETVYQVNVHVLPAIDYAGWAINKERQWVLFETIGIDGGAVRSFIVLGKGGYNEEDTEGRFVCCEGVFGRVGGEVQI